VAYSVTLNVGLKDVVLPNGQRYQGGTVVVLSDEEFSVLAPANQGTGGSSLFSAVAHVT